MEMFYLGPKLMGCWFFAVTDADLDKNFGDIYVLTMRMMDNEYR